jgi:hypothetical protein
MPNGCRGQPCGLSLLQVEGEKLHRSVVAARVQPVEIVRFGWIVEAAGKLRAKSFVIDGEGMVLGQDGVSGPTSGARRPAAEHLLQRVQPARQRWKVTACLLPM